MTETHAQTPTDIQISDIDLEQAVHQVFIGYPPIMHDRHRVEIHVHEGNVTLSGHVKSEITKDYLMKHIPQVEGVKAAHFDQVYDDDAIRREVGHVVPPGVFVTVEYGAVILSGFSPTDISVEELVRRVGQIPGVHRVLTSFKS